MSDEPLPADVFARLSRDFGNRADAMAELLLARRQIGTADFLIDRLVRCVIYAACSQEQRVEQLLDLAGYDPRDVIVTAEYDGDMQDVRDLRASFLIDSPEKFWAGETTCLMTSRGYTLTGLDSRPASTGPLQYGADHGEGCATFVGPKGEFVIEKSARQWMIQGNYHALAIHELDRPLSDERAFLDRVSGFLLSNL
jgi:hypothetical protein